MPDSDIEFKDGKFSVAGTDKSLAWTDVTLAAYVPHKYPIEDLEPGPIPQTRSGRIQKPSPAWQDGRP